MLPKMYRSDLDIRRHQINTLKIFNDNVAEICEGHEYQIAFKAGQHELCLHISLSNDFPNEKPFLKIVPSIAHPWVNMDSEVTGAPGLLNFTIHSDLGRVVQAIIREFERNPPPLLNDCTSGVTSPTVSKRDGEKPNNFSPPNRLVLPSIHNRLAFPELNKLTVEELEFLSSSVDKQQEFVNEIPEIKEQGRLLDEFILQVEEAAESNLAKQEQLEQLRDNVEKRIEVVTKLAFENERLHVEYQNLSDKYSPINIKQRLREAAINAEQESESIAEVFLKGEMNVDKFVNLYTKTRTLCQTRKTKEEKLSQQLDRLEKAGF